MSLPRAFQWLGVAVVVLVLVGLNFDFESEAGKTTNAPVTDRTVQGLLGYWKMDEGTGTSTTADASGNSNNLTMTNADAEDWQAGQIGAYSLDFNGTDEWLTVADPSSGVLDIVDGADFSIVGWFNRDLFAADHTIVATRNSQATNTDAGYIVWVDNNGSTDYLNFTVGDGGGTANDQYTAAGATDLSATGWHHFAAVWNDGAGMYLYLDGKLDGSTTSSTANIGSLANTVAFRIAAESDNGNPFDGKIDDVKLYSKALSANEVSRLYQTTVPVAPASTVGLDNGLVGHWTFDGPDVKWGETGSEIKDVSGRGNHGDAQGSLATTSVVPGKLGQGLFLSGTNAINAGSASSLDNLELQGGGGMTVVLWEKHSTYYGSPIGKNSATNAWYLYFLNSSQPFYFVKGYSSTSLHVESNTAPAFNQWNHIAVSWDGTVNQTGVHLYLNGVDVSNYASPYNATGSGVKVDDAGSDFLIGYPWGGAGNLYVDDVRAYNRVLTTSEITSLYNQGK